MQRVNEQIKLYFRGDDEVAIRSLLRMLIRERNGGISASVWKAHQFLESLNCQGAGCQDRDRMVAECRKTMTPDEFVQYVESRNYRWW